MTERQKQYSKNHEINLLVAALRFASLISRPMRDGVADPTGFSANELQDPDGAFRRGRVGGP